MRKLFLAGLMLSALAQSASAGEDYGIKPEARIIAISFYSPDKDGYFTASVNVSATTCHDKIAVAYSLTANHVKLVSEVKEQLKSQIETIDKDLSKDCRY